MKTQTKKVKGAKTVDSKTAARKLKTLAADHRLLKGLNEEQLAAVTHGEGPLLILAGAGTGKTKVITHRIAWLLATGRAKPEEIVALTFTEKAAAEMQERLLGMNLPALPEHIQTFHSFGDGILREYAYELDLPADFDVMGQAEQIIFLDDRLFTELPLKELRPHGRPGKHLKSLAATFSRAKNENKSPDDYRNWIRAETDRVVGYDDPVFKADSEYELARHREIADAFRAYETLKHEAGKLDYADQVFQAVRLLSSNRVIRRRLAQQFKYVLVDEYQDTNVAQNELLLQVAGKGGNLTVVGDDDQSIFSFQGAAVANILEFEATHPETTRVVLTKNYRSTQPILDAAYRLIRKNQDRLESRDGISKKLTANEPGGSRVVFDPHRTVDDEADRVAELVAERHGRGVPYYEQAVLVRTKALIEPFAQSLAARGIPYLAEGTGRLFDQPEIKMCVSFLRAASDPLDSPSLAYLIQSPAYGFPPDDFWKLGHRMKETHRPLWELLDEDGDLTDAGAAKAAKIREDLELATAALPDETVDRTLYNWLSRTGYVRKLREGAPELEQPARNLARLFERLRQFAAAAADRSARGWIVHLDDIIALEDESVASEIDAHYDAVRIMTVHAAKGLEFDVVYVVGCAERKFPMDFRTDHINCDPLLATRPNRERHLEEERRLFYVAMTRAKSELFLTAASDYRTKRPWQVSQFVTEVAGAEAAARMPRGTTDSVDRISQSKPVAPIPVGYEPPERIPLSYTHLTAYQACPWKYLWDFVIGLRGEKSFTQHYGTVIHQVIQQINQAKIHGSDPGEPDVLAWYERAWRNEGFLSAAHERTAFDQGKRTLLRFLAEEREREAPTAVEERFAFPLDGCLVEGTYDRIDRHKGLVTIVDYKTSAVTKQADANRRAREDKQLTLYALAHRAATGRLPDQVVFNFVESGKAGVSRRTDRQVDQMRDEIVETAAKIRAERWDKPNRHPHECNPYADCPGHRPTHRTMEAWW